MKVTFTYAPVGGRLIKAEVLSLGRRLSPLAPVEFSHDGVVQESHPIRSADKAFFGRGGGSVSESFVAQKEHATHWAAIVWTRVTIGPMRGAAGTLMFEDDTAGRISLVNAICKTARGHLEGITSFVNFQFVGGSWTAGKGL